MAAETSSARPSLLLGLPPLPGQREQRLRRWWFAYWSFGFLGRGEKKERCCPNWLRFAPPLRKALFVAVGRQARFAETRRGPTTILPLVYAATFFALLAAKDVLAALVLGPPRDGSDGFGVVRKDLPFPSTARHVVGPTGADVVDFPVLVGGQQAPTLVVFRQGHPTVGEARCVLRAADVSHAGGAVLDGLFHARVPLVGREGGVVAPLALSNILKDAFEGIEWSRVQPTDRLGEWILSGDPTVDEHCDDDHHH